MADIKIIKLTSIGQNIQRLRKSINMTQTELGARIYKTESTIRKYEAGNVIPPIEVLNSIAIELGVSIKSLIDFIDPYIAG